MSSKFKIITTVLLSLSCHLFASPMDSLRTEQIQGASYIIHRVEPQETLYGISRRYEIPVDEIKKHNPEVKNGLKMYAEIKIPLDRTSQDPDTTNQKTSTADYNPSDLHIVAAGETLYSISRKYGIALDQLQQLNQLSSNTLSVGDTLRINETSSPATSNQSKTAQTTTEKNEDYHIVAPSETLYSISKTYQIPLDTLSAINRLQSNNIGIGDTLWLGIQDSTAKPATPTSKEDIAKAQVRLDVPPMDSSLYHFVQPSETLFGISKKYGIDLDTLVMWNDLQSYNLSIGQQVIISQAAIDYKPAVPEPAPDTTTMTVEKKKAQLDTLYVKTNEDPIKTEVKVNDEGKIEIHQEGFAMEIDDTDHTRKFLALHRDAPPGTKMLVTNQMNGKSLSVRVVGTLPESGLNENVMLRISHAAFAELGALDFKIPVQASYIE